MSPTNATRVNKFLDFLHVSFVVTSITASLGILGYTFFLIYLNRNHHKEVTSELLITQENSAAAKVSQN